MGVTSAEVAPIVVRRLERSVEGSSQFHELNYHGLELDVVVLPGLVCEVPGQDDDLVPPTM